MSPFHRLRRSLVPAARKGAPDAGDARDARPSDKLDEEALPGYGQTLYYPAAVGDTLHGRYLVVGKLDYGAAATVWLAVDQATNRFVAIKIRAHRPREPGQAHDPEVAVYRRIAAAGAALKHAASTHGGTTTSSSEASSLSEADASGRPPADGPSGGGAAGGTAAARKPEGLDALRELLTSFALQDAARTGGRLHVALVHAPLWWDAPTLRSHKAEGAGPAGFVRGVMRRVLAALAFLHGPCGLIHTDVNASNVRFRLTSDAVLTELARRERERPGPVHRRGLLAARAPGVGGGAGARIVHESRPLGPTQDVGPAVLGGVGAAVAAGATVAAGAPRGSARTAPEVILGAGWDTAVDVWCAGVMAWELMQGERLFVDRGPEAWSPAEHLARVIALLGPPPPSLVERGAESAKYFGPSGAWHGRASIPPETSLEALDTQLDSEERHAFLHFVRSMLVWQPESRKTAEQLLRDPWLCDAAVGPIKAVEAM